MTDIPAELMRNIVLSLSTPNNYVLVRGVVNRFNTKTGGSVDPISVAEALIQKGYNIVGIPARKIAITPTPEGLIMDKCQIQQIIGDNQLSQFPLLEVAVQNTRQFLQSGESLKEALKRIANNLKHMGITRDFKDVTDPHEIVSKYISDRITHFEARYSDASLFADLRNAPKEDCERVVKSITQQAMFLFDNMDNVEQLITRDDRVRYEERRAELEDEERQAKVRKREELFASREAAERWLFGVARGAHRDTKRGVEDAAQELAKSARARDLLAHHSIDLFEFVSRQIEALGDERDRRREISRIEAPLAVLLTAFAKARAIDDAPHVIRKDPCDYLYRRISLWLDAKFVSELPDGVYGDVMRNESEYQERYRSRASDSMWGDSYGSLNSRDMDLFLEEMGKRDVERGENEMRGYESSRVAMLWWKCPVWLQWKILTRSVGDEFQRIGSVVRGFSSKQFLEHIDALIANENRSIKLQNTLIGTIDPSDMAAFDRYLKKITKNGPLTDQMMRDIIDGKTQPDSPVTERAEVIIKASTTRIRELESMRDAINLNFVMTRAEREAEIARRQKERSRFSFSAFGGRNRW